VANPSGYRIFTAGEVLTAANTMDFLMDQAIAVHDNAAAAGSALPSPAEGQFRYLKDTDSFQYFSGTSWQNAGASEEGFEKTFLLMGA